ncbi:MAG TPA: hypothetical protein VHW00_18965 [Thermoanaerobaculia bacterium]|nr:hypothetical protein [Thermoanaerobaculia bacterium]
MSVSRRDFALLALTAAAVPALGETAGTAASNPEAEARIAMILGKYGSRFTEEQKADIRRLITGAQEALEALRAYPLDNAIEPATLFRAVRNPARPKKVGTH